MTDDTTRDDDQDQPDPKNDPVPEPEPAPLEDAGETAPEPDQPIVLPTED